jgi:uncharacterized protein YjbI with pentapeptide repeats
LAALDRLSGMPQPSPVPSATPPWWPHCGEGVSPESPFGCPGIHVSGHTACLAHLAGPDRAAYLASLTPGADIDHRGTLFTESLLSALLDALRDPTTGHPHVGDAVFESATFVGPADFESVTFTGPARFESATFKGPARFPSATFESGAGFESAAFEGSARFSRATFTGTARFESATFKGPARFTSPTFEGPAGFSSATFEGPAGFTSATFEGQAGFTSATFEGPAVFTSATFKSLARFESATFKSPARFRSATFESDAWFESATFKADAGFASVTFKGDAGYTSATFESDAWFESATFKADAGFARATFEGDAVFASATLEGRSGFARVAFEGHAVFTAATFKGPARFESATFKGVAVFTSTTFESAAVFTSTTFEDDAGFARATFVEAGSVGPLVCAGRIVLSGAVFGSPVTLSFATYRLECRRTRWSSTADIRLRYATVDFAHAVFEYPLTIAAEPEPFVLADGSHLAEAPFATAPGPKVRVASLRGVDAAHLVLSDVDLTVCLFVGTVHLDQLRLEGACTFDTVPPAVRWRRWPPVRFTERRALAEEHHWRARQPGAVQGWNVRPRGRSICPCGWETSRSPTR